MSDITDEYEMEAGTSGLLETCDDSRMLIDTVGTIVAENNTEEKYFVVTTDVDEEQENLIQIAETGEKLNGNSLIEENQLWDLVCRICANTSDHLIPIFKGEGLEHEFDNKIQRYLPIRVSEEDNLPLHLCYHCAATLLAWHELVDGCLEAEQRLIQMQNESRQKNQSNILSDPLDDKSEAASPEDTAVSTKTQSRAEDPVKEEHSEDSTADDNERFSNYVHLPRSSSFTEFRRACLALRKSLRKRVQREQWPEGDCSDNGNDRDRSSPISASAECQLSEKQLISTIVLHGNVTDVTNVANSSPVVVINDSVISTAFSQPIIIENNESVINVSSELQKSSEVEEVQSVSTVTSYDCKLCNKKFQSEESYRAHVNTHTDAKRYTCHICGKQFGQTGSLYYHLKHVHGGVKQHSCDLCGRSFAMKAAMEDHRRIHTGERPYCCASCGKTFKTKASLYIHSKTHTDELPHKCSYCPKAFRWRQQMLGHLTIHTGQKNHICEICGKRFGVKNDLTRHKRIHSEEKPFSCQQCGLSFGQKRYLKNHERTRHR